MYVSLAIMANILWGSTFLASKHLLSSFGALEITFFRFAITSILIIMCQILFKKSFQLHLIWKHFGLIMLLGITSYTGLYYFQIEGLKHVSTSYSAIIMLASPIFSVIISDIFFTRKLIIKEYLLLFIAFIGGIILVVDSYTFNQEINFLGISYTAISAVLLGASVPITKKLQQNVLKNNDEVYSPFNLTLHTMLIGTIINFFLIMPTVSSSFSKFTELNHLLWFGYLSLFCSFFAFISWNYVIKYLTANFVSITMYIKTPVAILLGLLFLDERLSVLFFVGSVLIIASIYLQKYFDKRA